MGKITLRQFNSLLGCVGYVIGYELTGRLEDDPEGQQMSAEQEFEELKKSGRW